MLLEDFLHDNDKPLKPSDITVKQFENLQKWSRNFQKAVKDKFGGAADKGTILGGTDLRRDPGMKFNAKVSINEVPIFTTCNNHLAIMKLPNKHSTKCVGIGRLLSMEERCEMHGVVPQSLVGQTENQKRKSLGGMFPVNMAGVALREIMCLWAKFEAKLLRVPRGVPRPDPPPPPRHHGIFESSPYCARCLAASASSFFN